MGPSLILDKSVVQSMNQDAAYEQARYFWTNVTPLIALEILGDLSKFGEDGDRARGAVQALAGRLHGIDSHVNMDAEDVCVGSLLGAPVPMTRVTLVDRAYSVPLKSGGSGAVIPQNPVADALLRWHCGAFSEGEALLAYEWRRINRGVDLEALKKRLGSPVTRINSLDELRARVDQILEDHDLQATLLDWFLEQLSPVWPVAEWTRTRWRSGGFTSIRLFAPYAFHCLRVELFFSMGLQHGLIGTRATNRLDMRYYWYTPFAQVFSSRDRLHKVLSPFLLDEDQTFADGDDLVAELRELAARRGAGRADEQGSDVSLVEPEPGSLIHDLWERHISAGFRPQSPRSSAKGGDIASLPPQIREIIDAMREAQKKIPPPPKWPV